MIHSKKVGKSKEVNICFTVADHKKIDDWLRKNAPSQVKYRQFVNKKKAL